MRRLGLTAVVSVICLLHGVAAAQQHQQPAQSKAATEGRSGRDAWAYGGVTLGGGDPPQLQVPPQGLQFVTWPGFRVDPKKGTAVFLQLTGPVTYKTRTRGRRVEVTLNNVRVYLRNNLRPVITRHFGGPVSQFALKELKGDRLRLVIRLSRRVKPTVSLDTRQRYTFLSVVFPPKAARR